MSNVISNQKYAFAKKIIIIIGFNHIHFILLEIICLIYIFWDTFFFTLCYNF